ncbi:hypothetical protein ACIP3A_39045 [Streptomyces tricolor]|uniref:hypothetical protein n=1 Tax=Streptomyces tricolor TaxID=68277 RepID=UPI0037FC97A1
MEGLLADAVEDEHAGHLSLRAVAERVAAAEAPGAGGGRGSGHGRRGDGGRAGP